MQVVLNALEKQLPPPLFCAKRNVFCARNALCKQLLDVTEPFLGPQAPIFTTSLLSFLESSCSIDRWDARFASSLASLPHCQPTDHDGSLEVPISNGEAVSQHARVEFFDCPKLGLPCTANPSGVSRSSTRGAAHISQKKQRACCTLERESSSCRLDTIGLQCSSHASSQQMPSLKCFGERFASQPSLQTSTCPAFAQHCQNRTCSLPDCSKGGTQACSVELKECLSEGHYLEGVSSQQKQHGSADPVDLSTSIEANSNSDTLQSGGSHAGLDSEDDWL